MDNSIKSEFDLAGESAAAYSSEAISYATVSEITFPQPQVVVSDSLTLAQRANYLYCEHLKGILFVLASAIFILAVPLAVTRAGWLKTMLGKVCKRSLDIVGAFVGLVLTLPVWLILPILIKLDSRGPVLYTQVRVGINRRKKTRRFFQKEEDTERRRRERRRQDYMGKTFKVIKFRTMRHMAEKDTGPVWATRNDPRITRLGSLMRKTRLDELPQLLNILKGEMSLVGPRPERPAFVRELVGQVEGYSDRLSVKPGLTGLAQVESGYDSSVSSVAEKVMYDLEYIRKQSVVMDLRILCKTVIVVLTGRGAC